MILFKSPYYVTRTSANEIAVYWSRDTVILWDIIVFRLASYLWNMICFILQLLYKIAYNFRIILTKFYVNFSRQEHQIDILYVSSYMPEILRFYPIFPVIFLYSSFNIMLNVAWSNMVSVRGM